MNYKFQLPNNHSRSVVAKLRVDAESAGSTTFVPSLKLFSTNFYYQINIYGLEDADAAFLILKYNLAVKSKVPDDQII